jgi:hypothetical protein
VKEGDRVVQLGAILASKLASPPKLVIAEDMKRGAAPTRVTEQAGKLAKP